MQRKSLFAALLVCGILAFSGWVFAQPSGDPLIEAVRELLDRETESRAQGR